MDSMFQVIEILVKGLGKNIKKNKLAIHHRGTEGTEEGACLLGRRKNFFRANLQPCGQEMGSFYHSQAGLLFEAVPCPN
jgi:hypothetical protein